MIKYAITNSDIFFKLHEVMMNGSSFMLITGQGHAKVASGPKLKREFRTNFLLYIAGEYLWAFGEMHFSVTSWKTTEWHACIDKEIFFLNHTVIL